MYIVDVDTGGTMTDGLVTGDGQLIAIKVDTTPHDFTVCFRDCLAAAGGKLGFATVAEFLEHVDFIRWSSTITTNVLGERRGSKIGLMVSAGHEQDLYGVGPSPTLGQLVAEHNVIGLPANPTHQDVMQGLKRLLEEGVRRICISLGRAYPDNTSELHVKQVIEEQYPDHSSYWPEYDEFRETPIYAFASLTPGNVIIGPAVIEADLTTVVLPSGQQFSIDRFGLGVMEEV